MNSKRIVSMIGAAAVAASMALSSLPVCAAVTTMPDGGQFDAAYYAATYPDVAAALGTDANALYQHYKTFGVKEGRLPYAAGSSTINTATTKKTVVLNAREKANAIKILNEYLSADRGWGLAMEVYYNYQGQYASEWDDYGVAVNPRFGFADLDGNGKNELYTCGSAENTWAVYDLSTGIPKVMEMTSYSPVQNLYGIDYNDDECTVGIFSFVSTYGDMLMALSDVNTAANTVTVRNGGKTPSTITVAEYNAFMSTFVPIEQLVQVTALTPAAVKAIK